MPRRSRLLTLALIFAAGPGLAFPIQNNCWPNSVTLGLGAEGRFELAREANVGWVRITIPWRDVNPAPDVWRFDGIDGAVTAAEREGLQVLAVLSTAPEWAGGGPRGNTPPADVGLWAEYVRRTAERYARRIAAYEIWNEPNLQNIQVNGVGWDRPLEGSPRYTDYLDAAARRIRNAAPGTLVVGPVTSSRPNSRTETIYRQLEASGVSGLIDVISFHGNGTNRRFDDVIEDVERSLEILRRFNPSNAAKPIWITEFGWFGAPTGRPDLGGENGQRNLIDRIVRRMAGDAGCVAPIGFAIEGDRGWANFAITHAFIFQLLDIEDDPSGVYRADGSPKPVVTDYLRALPFPARQASAMWQVPFTWSCSGLTCQFQSQLFDPSGEIVFRWQFGDGSRIQDAGATITHSFPRAGQYFVRQGIEERGSRLSLGGDIALIRVGSWSAADDDTAGPEGGPEEIRVRPARPSSPAALTRPATRE